MFGAGLTLICASAHTPCSCDRFGFPDQGREQPLPKIVVVSNGHFVRPHARPVWGNSMVGDFDVGFTASTLNRRIATVDQLPSVTFVLNTGHRLDAKIGSSGSAAGQPFGEDVLVSRNGQ